MLKCRELSRLTKVPRFTSILWRNQTPGSPHSVLDNSYVYLAKNAQSQYATLLDSSHPATKLKPQQIPSWQSDGIKVRLVPMALLRKPEPMYSGEDPFSRPFLPWAERIQHAKKVGMRVVSTGGIVCLFGAHNQKIDDFELFPKIGLGSKRPGHRSVPHGAVKDLMLKKLALRIPMSYLTATSKERMGPKRYMRRRITTRIKTALNLIVTRGAYVDQSEVQNETGQLKKDGSEIKHNPLPRLKFDNEEASLMGEKWIVQGWSYIFYPTTEVYNMPYPKLVTLLRQCLQSLYKSAAKLERQWLKEALLAQPLPRLKHQQTNSGRIDRENSIKPAFEPSIHGHQIETAGPRPCQDLAYSVVEKIQKPSSKHVRPIKSPTVLKCELWETQLRSGLAIMQERLGKYR